MTSAQNWPPCLQAALTADNHETLRANLQIAAGVIAGLERRASMIECGLIDNGCNIVEKADDGTGPWVRNARAEQAEARVGELERRVSDREAELLRCRTHETQAAHLLDQQLSPEERATFASLCNRIAELERSPTFADAVRVVEDYKANRCMGIERHMAAGEILARLRELKENP